MLLFPSYQHERIFERLYSNHLSCSAHFYRPLTKLREGYVFTGVCDSVGGGMHAWLLGGGACVVAGGVCMVALGGFAAGGRACLVATGGMHGCSGRHVWLLQGGMCGYYGGHAWLLQGGMHVSCGGQRTWIYG